MHTGVGKNLSAFSSQILVINTWASRLPFVIFALLAISLSYLVAHHRVHPLRLVAPLYDYDKFSGANVR
jgi:hypothetical protein